jgi:hypothetical protein
MLHRHFFLALHVRKHIADPNYGRDEILNVVTYLRQRELRNVSEDIPDEVAEALAIA